ncbi:hypothetical protein GOP47_0005947 [Adiantum capillus-veneris]|uniref:Uncharacterized protein n=1 Tax=Adiantum capillus-veneris TaxID=13818 RepID=A0A9D4V2M3_ADICA|nr:hypothetical protein GOP47_0005947 [Adiantum capillus-veneris]
MSRIYVGNVDPRASERDLEDEFRMYGVLRSVWVARKPPGFAFVEFEDRRDASDAIRALNGKNGWRVELSRGGSGGGSGGGPRGGGGGRGGEDMKCYECGESGHFARECRLRIGPSGLGSGVRARSRSPRFRRSPSYTRGGQSPRRRSPVAFGSKRSRSPVRARSGYSPPRERSLSRSPPPRRGNFKNSPPANGSPRERRFERTLVPWLHQIDNFVALFLDSLLKCASATAWLLKNWFSAFFEYRLQSASSAGLHFNRRLPVSETILDMVLEVSRQASYKPLRS